MIQKSSFKEDMLFNDNRVAIKVILETSTSKEIRILFRKGQKMKEHKTPFPITVQVLEGEIEFGVNGEKHVLKAGDIIALEGNVPHDLFANAESMVRLSLSKTDKVERVLNVINNP